MSRRETVAFAATTAAIVFAIAAFGWHWIQSADRVNYPGAWLIATLVLGYHLGSWVARWLALEKMRRPEPVTAQPGMRVGVATTFVPGGEPIEMLEQTVRAIIALDYPHDTWVLDEGDDPEVGELCRRLGAHHFSRKRLARYRADEGAFAARTKHGNYNSWLEAVAYDRYDCIVTFDTDHVPERHFLTRVLGYFRDPEVAYVQAPQCYYNQDASFIARGAAEETYAYHSVHQMASFGLGQTILVGCHMTHRVAALREVGGFPAHDAEDLLLTSLYRGAASRGVYVPEVLALGTAAVDWPGYLRQQIRWARSVLNVKLRAYANTAGRVSLTERLLILFHGSYYLRSLTLPAIYALLVVLMLTGARPSLLEPPSLLRGGALLMSVVLAERFRRRFFLDPRREGGLHWRCLLLQLAKWPFFLVAIWHVLARQRRPYALTVKVGGATKETLLRWPHVLVALTIAAAWIVGRAWHDTMAPSLTASAAGVILASLGIAWTETRRFPPPFEPGRYTNRRAKLADVLGTAQPAVEAPAR